MTIIITILDIVQAAGACCRKGYSETFKTFQFGKDRSFYGVSEYDAQFVPKMAAMPPAPPVTEPYSLTAAMNARYSAHNLLRPPPPPAVEETPPVASRTGAKISSVTENNQSYQWPEKSKLASKTPNLQNSHKSGVIIGLNHPAVMKPNTSAGKVPFRSNKGPKSAHTAEEDSFSESEFQSSFADPEETFHAQENRPLPANVSIARKYQLMSQELKNRHGEGSRSDYTTGVLYSSKMRNLILCTFLIVLISCMDNVSGFQFHMGGAAPTLKVCSVIVFCFVFFGIA